MLQYYRQYGRNVRSRSKITKKIKIQIIYLFLDFLVILGFKQYMFGSILDSEHK